MSMWTRNTANTISGRPAGRSGRKLFAAVLAVAASVWGGLTAVTAHAYDRFQASPPLGYGTSSNYANPTDALMTYPCFGALIYPSVRHCRPYQSHGYGYGYGYGSYASSVTIDCDRDSYRYITEKVRRVRPGGAIFVTGTRRCKVSLSFNSSVALIGKPTKGVYPVLEAMDGQPCLRAGPRADKIVVRNITFVATRGQGAACIDSSARELTLADSNLRYDGEEAAIKIGSGRFNLYNSNVVARTLTSAIDIDRASFYAENSRIASTYNGIRGNIVDDSRVIGLTFVQLGDWQGFVRGEGAKAVDLKLLTAGSVLTVDQLKVLFYGNGLYLSGAGEALVSNSLFYSDHAVNSSLDRVRILNNYIFADEIGIDVQDGTAFVGNNHIQLVRTAGIVAATQAKLRAVNNHIMTLRCDTLRDGDRDRAPAERSCTPWHKDAAFGIPGGGVDWSVYALLEEACSQSVNDPRAGNVCDIYREKLRKSGDGKKNTSLTKSPALKQYAQLMDQGCATIKTTNSPLDRECRAHAERSKTLASLKADSSIPNDQFNAAFDDYDRMTMESLKRLCFATEGGRPKEWSAATAKELCGETSRIVAYDSSSQPYEDDETNLEIPTSKEWLMTLLYQANEQSPSGLYTLSSTSFMPLFDTYRPEYVVGKPTPKATDYFKPKS